MYKIVQKKRYKELLYFEAKAIDLANENKIFEKQKNDEYEENRELKKALEMLNNRNMRLKKAINEETEDKFKTNIRLFNQLDQANKRIDELEIKCKKLEKRKIAFEKLYKRYKDLAVLTNNVNVKIAKKLWSNKEAQRQLRMLADDEKINNINKLKTRVKELAMLIGI